MDDKKCKNCNNSDNSDSDGDNVWCNLFEKYSELPINNCFHHSRDSLLTQLEKAEVISNKKDEVISKLIQLLLLTDYSVSNYVIGDVQFIQWQSFLMDFPEYIEDTPSEFLSSPSDF